MNLYTIMLKRGKPRHGATIKRNAGHGLSEEVINSIASIPQIKNKKWTRSYLAEQLWRCYLGLPSDYSKEDLEKIAQGKII